jgi:hypothetical protein
MDAHLAGHSPGRYFEGRMMTLDFGLTQIFQVKRIRLHGHRRTYHQAEHGYEQVTNAGPN